MKNKRNVLIAFILICCLCLSIGYAALTDTLYVQGTATVNVLSEGDEPTTPFEKKFMEEIYWSDAKPAENTVTATRTTEAESKIDGANDTLDSATKPDALLITIPAEVLTVEGDSTTITATVKNDSDYNINAVLSAVTDNDTSNYYTITWAWANNGTGAINQGATADVTITVTLTKAPITDTTATFNMTLTATATG